MVFRHGGREHTSMQSTTVTRRVRRKIVAALLSASGFLAFTATAASAGTTWN